MIIGFDAKRAFFNHSGLGNYSRDVIRLMCKYYPEHQYNLYAPDISKGIFSDIPLNANQKTPLSLTGKILKSYWRSFAITSQLLSDKVSLYHGLSNELPFTINTINIKNIVTIHDLIFLRYPEFYNPIDRKIYKKKFIKSCIIADKIIAISNQTKADIVNFFNIDEVKIETVYQTCNTSFKQIESDVHKAQVKKKYNLPTDFILSVGTIEKRKNLLNICKALYENKIDIPLIAIGRLTSYTSEVKKYIFDKGLEKQIFLFHHVDSIDLPAIYQLAKVFVYPSVFEGFGIPILEALYSGIPVITTKYGCFSEAGGPNSLYVNPDKSDEIGDAISKVISDEHLRQTMIEKGLQYAQRFNDKNVAENLMRVYLK